MYLSTGTKLCMFLTCLIQVIYGGTGYSHTFQLILKQSPLIEMFRQIHTSMQDHFHLLHRSIRHAPASLKSTLDALGVLLEDGHTHTIDETRQARKIMDHLREGMRLFQTGIDTHNGAVNESNEVSGLGTSVGEEDLDLFND